MELYFKKMDTKPLKTTERRRLALEVIANLEPDWIISLHGFDNEQYAYEYLNDYVTLDSWWRNGGDCLLRELEEFTNKMIKFSLDNPISIRETTKYICFDDLHPNNVLIHPDTRDLKLIDLDQVQVLNLQLSHDTFAHNRNHLLYRARQWAV